MAGRGRRTDGLNLVFRICFEYNLGIYMEYNLIDEIINSEYDEINYFNSTGACLIEGGHWMATHMSIRLAWHTVGYNKRT